ncbi:secondary thiamine-phosphate synthase enzyme YjbQ [Hyphococcus sp.]|uniref:secondary thiamine-phosphate synthase enzyme YjbQ n=1 Tax=Hyphococcus sp. TaxID=2038636 RepID=UPI00208B6658|nr:MAG: hypothetical protein DHS20C04_06710 [Marinicaulis sp.]
MTNILMIETHGRSATAITDKIDAIIATSGKQSGLAHLFIQHTSASLLIQENADPDVLRDLIDWFDRIAPENGLYRHTAEGPDDMPAHLKSAVTSTSLTIPFENKRLLLGVWQDVYILEHRKAPYTRRIIVTLIEAA